MLIKFNAQEAVDMLMGKEENLDKYGFEPYDIFEPIDRHDVMIDYAFAAYNIMQISLHYTPVKTGKLKESIYIKKVDDYYEVGYTAPYAIYVHEIIDNSHAFPAKAKFLEDAAVEIMAEYGNIGTSINVSIEYDPLRVYIGGENLPGASLIKVKQKEKENRNSEAIRDLLDYLESGRN